jgi:hypothetical protein
MTEDTIIQDAFDLFMEDYELDTSMSFEDMMYEMFASGFETALELIDDNDED